MYMQRLCSCMLVSGLGAHCSGSRCAGTMWQWCVSRGTTLPHKMLHEKLFTWINVGGHVSASKETNTEKQKWRGSDMVAVGWWNGCSAVVVRQWPHTG